MSKKVCHSAIDVLMATNFPFDWSLHNLSISPALAELLAISYAQRDEEDVQDLIDAIYAEQKVAE